ncbi:MAG: RNA methylase [Hyphomicrobiaceae bacterium]|nr:RNA methylase [Hyphomicrobiaceae bacterium]
MTEFRIAWHQYRYFPYERELARREAVSLLGLDGVEEAFDGLVVPSDVSKDDVERLTYFASLRNGHDIFATMQSKLESSVSLQKRQATRYSVHGLHEYKGKFNPQVAKSLMNIFRVGPGSRVLDPFCGSGTTLIEAAQLGADAVGTDLNPFAIFLADAKQLALSTSATELRSILQSLDKRLKRSKRYRVNIKDDRLAYLGQWFEPKQLVAIESLRVEIEDVCGSLAPVFLTIASDMLREYSLQDPNDLRIRRRSTPLPDAPFAKAFLEKALHTIDRVDAAQKVVGINLGTARAKLLDNTTINSRTFSGKFDCAITSPPYAMALPYIDTQRLSLVWLGLIEPAEVLPLESRLIGSREMRGSTKRDLIDALRTNVDNIPSGQLKLCRKLANSLKEKDGFRRQAVPMLMYRYFSLMQNSFVAVRKSMKRNAPFALVVGHNHTTLGGKRFDIDTPRHLAEIAVGVGWTLDELMPLQTYQRYGYHSANAVAAETLILLRSK